jgi:hypothetical protein
MGLAAYEEGIMSIRVKPLLEKDRAGFFYGEGGSKRSPEFVGGPGSSRKERLKRALRRQRGKGNATMMAQRFAKGLFKT